MADLTLNLFGWRGVRNNQKLMFLLYNFVRAGTRGWKDA